MSGVSPGLTRVAIYRRELPVSCDRVWENVRDWEHLPWLHAGSFASIDLADEGDWGWRARIGRHGGGSMLLELVIEPDEPRYVSRTLEGAGAGSEIWTTVDSRGDDETHVRVEFWVPMAMAARSASLGERYIELYTRLWDEDERMMQGRDEALTARRARPESEAAPVALGPLAALLPRLPLVVDFAGERFRVVELDGSLVAHSIVCPHWLGPLDAAPIEGRRVVCPWHGYAFDIVSRRECSGRRMRLAAPPRVLVDAESGQVTLARHA